MAIPRGHRFPIQFNEAFQQGLVMVGEVSPDTEYHSREGRTADRVTRQRVGGDVTGKRRRKVAVTDPLEQNAKRASYVTLSADVQPMPTTSEVLPGMRPVELDSLTAEPRVAGNGEFKYQSFAFRATGFKAVAGGGGRPSKSGAREQSAKAA